MTENESGEMMMKEELSGKLGFGCMRLPMDGDKVNDAEFCRMIDAYLDAGFTYFDTAHGYLAGESEKAIGRCLSPRHARNSYLLADKLTETYFKTEDDIRPFVESQLETCGTDYFDFYLMHAQNAKNFEHFKACRAYETVFALRDEGKLRHIGFSFHDSPEVLDMILQTYPEVEFVQLQYNYLDQEDPNVQSRACMEVCEKHGKPVVVMEPVKGGTLAALPEEAAQVIAHLEGGSPASYAIRYAASHDNVMMVLSGMGSMEMMEDNLATMKNFQPLDETERKALERVVEIYNEAPQIGCTACGYCLEGCPKHIQIPKVFKAVNRLQRYQPSSAKMLYNMALKDAGSPEECLLCGKCEHICPQQLPIRTLLEKAVSQFDELEN